MGHDGRRESVQLIAYADRFGGSLAGLREILNGPLAGLFGGVHILPFFTSFDGADAGFDPVDHTEVDPRLGSWEDVQTLARDYVLMVDLIVNHVSADCAQFRDVLARGDASPHARMFLTMSDVYPRGADESELAGIYRPRPGLPFTAATLGGQRRLVWTTFTSQQIDLNLNHPAGRAYLDRVLIKLADSDVSIVRLDAVGYAIKTPGTSSFMTAATFAFIAELTARARELVAGHQEKGDFCAIVTATNEFVTAPIAREFGVMHLVATEIEQAGGRFTGKPHGTPCFREGKVTRVGEWLAGLGRSWGDFPASRFYSDSHNDLPLLERVTHPVAVSPDAALKQVALARGWDVIALA